MKILFACSGSGGHVFPALALAIQLSKQKDIEILFIQTKKPEIDKQIEKNNFRLVPFNLGKVSFGSIKTVFISVFRLIIAFVNSFIIIIKFKPDIVAGFGGYHSGPVVLIAHFMGLPTIIHEQNVLPGKANYILSKFVDKIAVTFQESIAFYKTKKSVLTGCPVRKEIIDASKEEACKKFNLKDDKFTIFTMGGSKGSHNINLKFLEAISDIKEKEKIQVIHIAGYEDYDFVVKAYSKMNINSLVFAFLEEIGYAYKLADIAIIRAGGSTIAELITLRLPAIIIPYPFAGGHQLMNARILVNAGAAFLIEDQQLSSYWLKERISSMMLDRDKIIKMKQAFSSLDMSDATEKLSRELLSLKKC